MNNTEHSNRRFSDSQVLSGIQFGLLNRDTPFFNETPNFSNKVVKLALTTLTS